MRRDEDDRLSVEEGAPAEEPKEEVGLRCPSCWCQDLRVVETRKKLGRIYRVRRCRHCGRRLSTSEKLGG